MDQNAWEYLVRFRWSILTTVNGIENAESLLWWDNTTPNYRIRSQLQQVLKKAIKEASLFGVFVVTRHLDCGRKSHNRVSDYNGYVWSNPYGLDIGWKDERFVWDGDQLFQGMRTGSCPCSQASEISDHHVIDDIIYSPEACTTLRKTICHVLSDIQSAIEVSGDRQPRSGIREHLLRAILILNDAIMPLSVEAHIKEFAPHLTK
jgi:hypothetical protein